MAYVDDILLFALTVKLIHEVVITRCVECAHSVVQRNTIIRL